MAGIEGPGRMSRVVVEGPEGVAPERVEMGPVDDGA